MNGMKFRLCLRLLTLCSAQDLSLLLPLFIHFSTPPMKSPQNSSLSCRFLSFLLLYPYKLYTSDVFWFFFSSPNLILFYFRLEWGFCRGCDYAVWYPSGKICRETPSWRSEVYIVHFIAGISQLGWADWFTIF